MLAMLQTDTQIFFIYMIFHVIQPQRKQILLPC